MTTTSAPLAEYQNGNCRVQLYADGSKVRSWPDGESPRPEFPESVDLKITDYCDAGCPFCHESSTKRGKHADRWSLMSDLVDGLPRGVEIAIGGGNSLDHPNLADLLGFWSGRGLVCNLTINAKHLRSDANNAGTLGHTAQEFIRQAQQGGSLHGVGVSYVEEHWNAIKFMETAILPANLVHHMIVGVHDPSDVWHLRERGALHRSFLLLGYKQHGFGRKCDHQKVADSIHRWRYWLPSLVARPGCRFSFDNLACEQLGLAELVTEDRWRSLDGQ